ncbi:MAG: 16S rRNA (adenine(1518)-N(6)/adenine(1519)-N(6))-dimethyltransferase RsmA [Atopobiaceae bacterium]|nr:16S rRNA (adenine(1518)-N(6)/adenine(1519)-N(6))-dimethyltransferase RsmA [Atopobiaceae bacterium]
MPVYSWLASPRETRDVLDRHGLTTKHRLGQNFLISDAIIGKILDLAELHDTDVVFEVGPGIGTLTVAMLPLAGAVVSVEADRSLKDVLAETCARDSERFALEMGDALHVDGTQLRDAVASLGIDGLDPMPNKLVSNLPYQVAATLVLQVFEQMPSIERAVVMVQAEVADRMTAVPGSKTYGGYTTKLALFARPTGRFEVGPNNFMPPPHVDSAVIRLDRSPVCHPLTGQPLSQEQIAWCCQVIDAAFAQRRKTIRNSMAASGFEKDSLDIAFEQAGINPKARAETLAPTDFVRLSCALEMR